YDSRVYAKLYRRLGGDLASQKEGTVTAKSAHLGFLTEVVEFLENSIPEIVSSLVGLVGTLVIIGTINISLMWGCLAVLMLTIIVYAATSRYTMALNTGYNQELERQVEVVSTNEPVRQKTHLKDLMRWNIRMSDLETINFSIVWILMISFLVGSIVFAVGNGIPSYGAIFSLVLYLFQFIESAIALPLFFQQGLRLKAIIRRLDNM
ncbi:MAG: ABC transporter six-transmembrane domain-containing protein, partial [Bacteroidota bacterium]